MTLPLVVELQPAAFDAGPTLSYAMKSPAGANVPGTLTQTAPGRWGGASTPILTDGTWLAFVSASGLDASVQFEVDRTNPQIALLVEPAPARVVDGGLSEVDADPQYATAFKRNEIAELRLQASEPVGVTTANLSGVPAPSLNAKTCTNACDAGQCTCFSLDLAQVTIPAPGFRGTLTVNVTGVQDRVTNPANVTSARLKVTRWKWKKLIFAATTVQPPAVDLAGNVFVGAFVGSTGALVGLAPNGAQYFWTGTFGAVTTAPVVGRSLYVATKDAAPGRIREIDRTTGSSITDVCAGINRLYDGPMAVVDLGGAGDRIVAVSHNGVVSAARPTAMLNNCRETTVTEIMANGRNYTVVANDQYAFLANTSDTLVTRIQWMPGSAPTWGSPTTNSPTLFGQGLALFGATLGGGGGGLTGGLYAMKSDNASFAMPTPARFTRSGGASAATGPVVVGTAASPVFIYGNGLELVRVAYGPGDPGAFDAGASTTAVTPTGFGIASTPVVGDDDVVYAVDLDGTVSAYSADLSTLLWRLAAMSNGIAGNNVFTAMNIDVARTPDGEKDCAKPGTLYVPSSGDGSLYAFIVDSKGIADDVPWPKFQFDPRNTANPSASLVDFSCP